MDLQKIPSGWNVLGILELCNEKGDIKPGPFGSALKKNMYVQAGYKVYGQEQVIPNDFHAGNYYIDQQKFDELKAFEIKPNDLLISCVGSFGKVAIVPENAERGIINPRLMKITFNEKVADVNFYKQYMIAEWFTKGVEALSHGGTMGIINKSVLLKIRFLNPPLPEQKKIAKILSVVDSHIDEVEGMIEDLQELKKGMMQKLLRKGIGHTEFKDSPVGRIPVEWEVKRLDLVSAITMGQSPKSSSYNENYVGVPLIQGNADIADRKTNPRFYTSKPTKECVVGDIIMSVRAPVGDISRSYHDACIGRGVCAIRPLVSVDSEFLYQLLISMESRWKCVSQGSTFTAVNSTEVKSLELPIPSLNEQKKISDILKNFDRRIEQYEDLYETIQEFKKGLMQQLLTGKARVKIDEEN